MENNGYSLSDLRAVTGDGFGMNSGGLLFLLVIFILMGGFNRGGDYGQYATAASQQEILFGQQFQNIDNKIDRIGNGIADIGYATQSLVNNAQTVLGGAIVSEGRALGDKMCELKTAVHAEGEATRALIQQNKIESLQAQVNELKTQNMFCGIPRINPYGYGVYPYSNGGCATCGNCA